MKKLSVFFLLIILLLLSHNVFAFDEVSNFYMETKTLTIVPAETKTIKFGFYPEDAIGQVKINTSKRTPDSEIAVAKINDESGTVSITGVGPGTTTFDFTCLVKIDPKFELERTVSLTVNVVPDTVQTLETSIKSINTIYTGEIQFELVKITLNPSTALDLLDYFSDNEAVACVVPHNNDPTGFSIKIVGVGQTIVHVTAGSKKIDIPILVKSVESGLADPVLPKAVSKADVKAAYDKYIKQYNTPFQDEKILDCEIPDTETKNSSGSTVLTRKGEQVAQDYTNFLRTLSGLSPVTYTSESNSKAQYGATFMAQNSYGHSAADGIDQKASEILHSSNIGRHLGSANRSILEWFNERGNAAGVLNVGHRSWILDNRITDFGIATDNEYYTQYYKKSEKYEKVDLMAAYPFNGYFPIEALETATDVWSLHLGQKYELNPDEIKVTVTNDQGQTITLAYSDLQNQQGTYVLSIGYGSGLSINIYPKAFVGDYSTMIDPETLVGKSFTVTIEGLKIDMSQSSTNYYVPCKPLTYSIHFFSIAKEGWNPHLDSFTIIDTSTGKELESSFTMKVGEKKTIKLESVSPSIYLSQAELQGSNPLYGKVLNTLREKEDPQSTTLTAIGPGSGTIEYGILGTSLKRNYQVTVISDSDASDGNNSQTGDQENSSTSGTNSSGNTNNRVTIYRLYNSINGEHLYTTDHNEVVTLVHSHGWTDEGIGWYAPKSGKAVYRLYNAGLQNHLYTTDENEVKELTQKHGWVKDFEGKPLFYSGGTIPVYRVYNKELRGLHHLTTDENEYKTLPAYGWTQENVALNALAKP